MIKKVETAKKSIKQAKKADEAHQSDIQELESELRMIERKTEEFDKQSFWYQVPSEYKYFSKILINV
jgi:hypothetical protein